MFTDSIGNWHDAVGMESFDLINSSLDGTQLIDASAGTGKTFTIAGIFIRLVLEKQLDVHQILVVTYTRAATADGVRQCDRPHVAAGG